MVCLPLDGGPRTGLQHLIVLRLLRPDRLSVAVSSFVNETLQTDPDELPDEGLDQVLSVCRQGRHSILVLLPPGGGATSHALSNIEITQSVADSIEQLAKASRFVAVDRLLTVLTDIAVGLYCIIYYIPLYSASRSAP